MIALRWCLGFESDEQLCRPLSSQVAIYSLDMDLVHYNIGETGNLSAIAAGSNDVLERLKSNG